MDRSNRRLRVFQSLADESSPDQSIPNVMKSMQDLSFSFYSQSSTSSMQTDESFISDYLSSSKNDMLNKTLTESSSQNFSTQNVFKTRLVSNALSLADKFFKGPERKIDPKLTAGESASRKSENGQERTLNLSTEDSSKEEMTERGKPKKRPLGESEKKYYVIQLDMIKKGHDSRTTVMIKNIPNKYTQKMLLQTIDKKFRGTYDFLYLPIDFKNRCNVGYAFINFIDFRVIASFFLEFNEKRWERFNSEKICAIAYARIQGLKELVKHFQNSSVINQDDNQVRPVILSRH